jgi:hypothetical protein
MSSVELRGPLFQGSASSAVGRAVNDIERDLARRGQQLVQQQLTPGHGVETGGLRAGITIRESAAFDTVYPTNAIKGAWIEGASRRNQTTRFKGYRVFRRATQELEAAAPRHAQRRVEQLAHDLGGS